MPIPMRILVERPTFSEFSEDDSDSSGADFGLKDERDILFHVLSGLFYMISQICQSKQRIIACIMLFASNRNFSENSATLLAENYRPYTGLRRPHDHHDDWFLLNRKLESSSGLLRLHSHSLWRLVRYSRTTQYARQTFCHLCKYCRDCSRGLLLRDPFSPFCRG